MNYNQAIEQIEKILAVTPFATLATCDKNSVIDTAQMCIVNDGLKVYMQTDKTFTKVANIKQNANVAFNCGAYNFKGISKLAGHPSKNKVFVEKLKAKHLETYNHYTNLPNEVLIEIQLTECKIWGVDNNKDIHNQETILVVNLVNKTTKTIICDKM